MVVDIEFVKPCLFKGRIEAEAWSGLKKYYDMVDKEVGNSLRVSTNLGQALMGSKHESHTITSI